MQRLDRRWMWMWTWMWVLHSIICIIHRYYSQRNNGGELQKSLSGRIGKNWTNDFNGNFILPVFRRGFTLVLITHKHLRFRQRPVIFIFLMEFLAANPNQLCSQPDALFGSGGEWWKTVARENNKKYRFEDVFGDGENHLDYNQSVCWVSTGSFVENLYRSVIISSPRINLRFLFENYENQPICIYIYMHRGVYRSFHPVHTAANGGHPCTLPLYTTIICHSRSTCKKDKVL